MEVVTPFLFWSKLHIRQSGGIPPPPPSIIPSAEHEVSVSLIFSSSMKLTIWHSHPLHTIKWERNCVLDFILFLVWNPEHRCEHPTFQGMWKHSQKHIMCQNDRTLKCSCQKPFYSRHHLTAQMLPVNDEFRLDHIDKLHRVHRGFAATANALW